LNPIDCLAFAPHPDDAELFCSGLLLKLKKQGKSTAIVDLTLGELSTNGNPETRKSESETASLILKTDYRENLEIPDGNIENTFQNRQKVIKVIRMLRPKICLLPWREDRHPDHVQASHLLKHSVFYAGLKKIKTGQDAYRPSTVLYYILHKIIEPTFIVDISEEFEQKIAAIKSYKSQFGNTVESNTTYINRPEFLENIKTRCAYLGQQINCKFGEGFIFEGKLKINNLMDFFS